MFPSLITRHYVSWQKIVSKIVYNVNKNIIKCRSINMIKFKTISVNTGHLLDLNFVWKTIGILFKHKTLRGESLIKFHQSRLYTVVKY